MNLRKHLVKPLSPRSHSPGSLHPSPHKQPSGRRKLWSKPTVHYSASKPAMQYVQTSSAVKCRHPSQQCTAVQGIQATKLAIKPWERLLACQAASFHPPCLMTQWPVGRQTFPSLRPAAQTLAGRDNMPFMAYYTNVRESENQPSQPALL